MIKRGRPTSLVGGCKDGEVVALVGQAGEELTTGAGRVGDPDCKGEMGEARIVQRLYETIRVGRVLLSVDQNGGERQDKSREDENHV